MSAHLTDRWQMKLVPGSPGQWSHICIWPVHKGMVRNCKSCLMAGRSSVPGHAEEVSEAESRIESLVVMCHHRRNKIHQTASTSIPLLNATGL